MKILFCLHHFLPGTVGGTELYTFSLARELQQNGLEVVVVVPHFDSNITDEYQHENIRVIRYAENSANDRMMIMGYNKPEGLQLFEQILNQERPDVVHFQEIIGGRGPSVFFVEAAKALGFKIVLTTHLTYYTCFTGSLLYKGKTQCDGKMNVRKCTACVLHEKNITGLKGFALNIAANTLYAVGINSTRWNNSIATGLGLPWLVKKKITDMELLGKICDKIVVPAKFYGEVLKKNKVNAGKIRFIPQGLANITTSHHKKENLVSLPLKLVYLGRITKLKGLQLLLEALHSVAPEKIKLDIYGSFSENDDYESVCKKTGKNFQNVSWKGVLDGKAVQHTLANYDVLCLPSFFEMSPLVIQEAFAAGAPVLASDVPGNAEQIKDGINGWLFRCNDVQHLLLKINALLQNPGLIAEAQQHLPLPKLFSSVALEYRKLYEEILNNENNP